MGNREDILNEIVNKAVSAHVEAEAEAESAAEGSARKKPVVYVDERESAAEKVLLQDAESAFDEPATASEPAWEKKDAHAFESRQAGEDEPSGKLRAVEDKGFSEDPRSSSDVSPREASNRSLDETVPLEPVRKNQDARVAETEATAEEAPAESSDDPVDDAKKSRRFGRRQPKRGAHAAAAGASASAAKHRADAKANAEADDKPDAAVEAETDAETETRAGVDDDVHAVDDVEPKANEGVDAEDATAGHGNDPFEGLPSLDELRAERERQGVIASRKRIVGRIAVILVVLAALAAICISFFTPVLNITGDSMAPTLKQGNLVLCKKAKTYEQGDVVAFYLDNKVLVKRVVATEGQWVDIDRQGNVYVDGEMLDEPYLDHKAAGECDFALPYLVGEDEVFVLGDNRANSTDSRSASVGCVDSEQIMGRVLVKMWPPGTLGSAA